MKSRRVVVITCAAGGIGSVLVERFLENGDTVIATDLMAGDLHRLVDRLPGQNRLLTIAGNIFEESDCNAIAGLARDSCARIDVLVNCAGNFPMKAFEEISLAEWQRVLDINLTGVFLMIKSTLPLMKKSGWGRIINFSSGTFFRGPPNLSHYVSAKAGVIRLTRCLSAEFGDYGITVNAVTPGLTITEPVRKNFPESFLAMARQQRPLKHDQKAEDLVGAVYFLASPNADFITGQTINVDGGTTRY